MLDNNPFREYKEMIKKKKLTESDQEAAIKAANDEFDQIAVNEQIHELPGFIQRYHGVLNGNHIDGILDVIHDHAFENGYNEHHDAAYEAIKSHPAWEEKHTKRANRIWSGIEEGDIKDPKNLSGMVSDYKYDPSDFRNPPMHGGHTYHG